MFFCVIRLTAANNPLLFGCVQIRALAETKSPISRLAGLYMRLAAVITVFLDTVDDDCISFATFRYRIRLQ